MIPPPLVILGLALMLVGTIYVARPTSVRVREAGMILIVAGLVVIAIGAGLS